MTRLDAKAREPILSDLKQSDRGVSKICPPVPSRDVRVCGREIQTWNDHLFSQLRAVHGVPDDFLESSLDLGMCRMPTESKGGSPLYVTRDRKYIVKEISNSDHVMLVEHAKAFVGHFCSSQGSLMCPIYLHFSFEANPSHGATGSKGVDRTGNHHVERTRYMAMRNLMPSKGPWARKYDLKGCADDKTMEVDGHTIRAVRKRIWHLHMWCHTCAWSPERWAYYEGKVHARNLKLDLPKQQRDEIVHYIQRDVDWLIERNIMDYSLLLGIRRFPVTDPDAFREALAPCVGGNGHAVASRPVREWAMVSGQEVTVFTIGIIDFLQPWTATKEIARCIKVLETNKATVPPRRYGDRFKRHFAARLNPRRQLEALPDATAALSALERRSPQREREASKEKPLTPTAANGKCCRRRQCTSTN